MPAVIPLAAIIDLKGVLQIAILALIFFYFYRLFGGTRSAQMLIGVVMTLGALIALTLFFDLDVLRFLLGRLSLVLATALVVIFQQELRHAFLTIGNRKLSIRNREERDKLIDAVAEAAETLSMQQPKAHGALIVIERKSHLLEYAQRGTPLNIPVSPVILTCLFYPGAPLHDGAVIIRGDTILAAKCILPLSETDAGHGTRHRAALGISEVTDAVAIVVSEETRQISAAVNGSLLPGLTRDKLRQLLRHLIRSDANFDLPPGGSGRETTPLADVDVGNLADMGIHAEDAPAPVVPHKEDAP